MTNWEKILAEKAQRINRLQKQAVGNTRQDMSLPVAEELLTQGYTLATWDSGNSRHSRCVDLNKQVFDLEQMIRGTEYEALIFSRSHPGDINCTLVISGPNLPDVRLDSYGNTDSSIAPIKQTPKTKAPARPKRVKQAPVQKPKVEKAPLEPKKKYEYVPKKEWEQIPEQPSLHDVTESDREDWLSDLERETSLNKARNLLKGIVEE